MLSHKWFFLNMNNDISLYGMSANIWSDWKLVNCITLHNPNLARVFSWRSVTSIPCMNSRTETETSTWLLWKLCFLILQFGRFIRNFRKRYHARFSLWQRSTWMGLENSIHVWYINYFIGIYVHIHGTDHHPNRGTYDHQDSIIKNLIVAQWLLYCMPLAFISRLCGWLYLWKKIVEPYVPGAFWINLASLAIQTSLVPFGGHMSDKFGCFKDFWSITHATNFFWKCRESIHCTSNYRLFSSIVFRSNRCMACGKFQCQDPPGICIFW